MSTRFRTIQTIQAPAVISGVVTLGPFKVSAARAARVYIDRQTGGAGAMDVDIVGSYDGVFKAGETPIKTVATSGQNVGYLLAVIKDELPNYIFVVLDSSAAPDPTVKVDLEIEEGE